MNNNAKINYFCFNIFINKDKTRIDDIEQINELRQYMQLQSSDNNAKVKIAIAFLTTSFFFELKIVFLLKSKYYKCRDFIYCRNNNQTIIATLFRFLEFYLKLSTNIATLKKISQDNICKIYQLYRKNIIVRIRYLEDIVYLYIKFNITKRRKINKFSYSIL